MITGLSHVSIVVPDIEAAAKTLAERYGLTTGARVTNDQQGVRLAYVDLPGAKIELMQPSRPDSPVAKFLERNPKGGIHHLSLGVDSVETAVGALRDKGVRVSARASRSTTSPAGALHFCIRQTFSVRWLSLRSIEQPAGLRWLNKSYIFQ